MFSRLVKIAVAVFDFFVQRFQYVFIDPNFALRLQENAQAKNGIKIQQIKPLLTTWNLVTDDATISSSSYEKLLRAVMKLSEPNARETYSVINHVTSSNFFISMPDDKAQALRNRLSVALRDNEELLKQETEKVITDMLDLLRRKATVDAEVFLFLEHAIRYLMVAGLTGLRLTPKLQLLLDKKMDASASYGFLSGMPYWLRYAFSGFRERKYEFDAAMKEFLQAEFERMRCEPMNENSLTFICIKEKYPQANIAELLADQHMIDELIADPNVRLNITGSFATANLLPVINAGMLYLSHVSPFNSPRRTHRELIITEILDRQERNLDVLGGEYLQAYWLEILRCCSPMPGIVRSTEDGFKVGETDIEIPEKSILHIRFRKSVSLGDDMTDPSRFEPRRHLNQQNTNLHRGFFTPFGLGPRMCPATKISGIIFKQFIIAAATQLNEYSQGCVLFNDAHSSAESSTRRRRNL